MRCFVEVQTTTATTTPEPTTTTQASTTHPGCTKTGEVLQTCKCTKTCADVKSGAGCTNFVANADSNGQCCGCPDGKVYGDNGACVATSECKCKDNVTGNSYPVST